MQIWVKSQSQWTVEKSAEMGLTLDPLFGITSEPLGDTCYGVSTTLALEQLAKGLSHQRRTI